MSLDLEHQKENFKNHVATLTKYDNITILDFKNPSSSNYRIRFLFEEDYCKLHISGDLGQLIANNYNNMTYESFSDFVNNVGYFKEKINCHDRAIVRYDEKKAETDIKEYIKTYELEDAIIEEYDSIDYFIELVLEYFDKRTGISAKGYETFSEIDPDVFESISDFGKEETDILKLYMLAFKLAQENLIANNQNDKKEEQQ